MSRIESRLERNRALPDLSVGYYSQTMQGEQEVNGVPRTFGTTDRFAGVQAGITIPLWIAPDIARIKASKIKEKVAKTNAEQYAKSLSGTYNSLLMEFNKYANSLNYYENQALPEANMIIEQSTKSYRAGAMDYLDYVQSLSRALTIKEGYLETLNNYNQTIVSIEYIIGKTY